MIKELKVDQDKCTHCRMCTHFCLNNVIEWDEEKDAPVARYREDCVLCLICAMYCPGQAIELIPDYAMKHNPPAIAKGVK
ncbi:MAG: 4Fe-4S binding protein [Lachnospiraceae bacterium]|nr:4Fe-4S binding protein [Lachnospiraceae bacterium]MBR6349767.1 4Fe-4S binding protein [Lachnospiraceae bacterium]